MNRPWFIFELTPFCNYACPYCYCGSPKSSGSPGDFLSLEDIKKLFNKLTSEISPEGVTLIGGEPLLHPRIFDVVSFLRDKNISVGLSTNGSKLSSRSINKLVEKGVGHFEVSLDSLNEKTYRFLTGGSGLKKIKQKLPFIKNAGAALTVTALITRFTPGDLPGIMDFCFAASVNRLCLAQFVPLGAGAENRQELQIDAFGFKKVLAAANRFSGEYGLPIHIGVPVKPCCIDHKQYPSLVFEACMCGVDKWAIDPKGNLKTCELNREICGNLFERSFEELSGTKTAMEFRENNYGSDCPACEHWERCGGGCRFMPTA
ncbi:MAG: radical SAM protein [bacterium]|nr:radical SAM protein [bacterium]